MNRQDLLNDIADQVQSWLDRQKEEYESEGIEVTDANMLYRIQHNRGALKNWIKVLRDE